MDGTLALSAKHHNIIANGPFPDYYDSYDYLVRTSNCFPANYLDMSYILPIPHLFVLKGNAACTCKFQ